MRLLNTILAAFLFVSLIGQVQAESALKDILKNGELRVGKQPPKYLSRVSSEFSGKSFNFSKVIGG